jgi:Uma2 family endonuclease
MTNHEGGEPMSEAALAEPELLETPGHTIRAPHRPPYTVDDLFKMPDDGNRYEVLGGSLFVSPAASHLHQSVADELCRLLWAARPPGVRAVTNVAVRMPNDDGPIPDITVTSSNSKLHPKELPCDVVHTVVEVASPSNALMDRALKPQMYADAGIPCYWRVELNPWRAYKGPLPLIVVRLNSGDEWRTIEAAAGETAELPVAVGRKDTDIITISLDPADLLDM